MSRPYLHRRDVKKMTMESLCISVCDQGAKDLGKLEGEIVSSRGREKFSSTKTTVSVRHGYIALSLINTSMFTVLTLEYYWNAVIFVVIIAIVNTLNNDQSLRSTF